MEEKFRSMLLVGLEPGEREVATAAARSLFPEALVTDLKDQDEFVRAAERFDGGLVVTANGHAAKLAETIRATDDAGLPRWAVIVLGGTADAGAAGQVPRANWTPPVAAQAFRAAASLYALRRDNIRLRGDLKTVASRFSHDVRSPVGAILTTCELIKELGEAPDPTLMRAITDSADEVSRLVEQLTVVLRASADPKPPEAVDMSDVVFRSLQRVQYECHEKKIAIDVPEKWPTVRGVSKYLEVVWDCLLADALRYGGESPRLRIGWSRDARDYAFWIDADSAIPPELHGKMFLPFHVLYDQNDGGGLVLSIVRRLVEIHGGCCEFEALPNDGSRFRFTLPIPDGVSLDPVDSSVAGDTTNA